MLDEFARRVDEESSEGKVKKLEAELRTVRSQHSAEVRDLQDTINTLANHVQALSLALTAEREARARAEQEAGAVAGHISLTGGRRGVPV